MRLAAPKDVSRPALAVVGVWDPLLSAHQDLLRRLGDRARERSLTSVAIVLHPSPAALLNGRANWPVYHDLRCRLDLLTRSGVDAALPVRFFRRDLFATAADFFDVVISRLHIEELWIGARQTLGSGAAGAGPAIADLSHRHAIRLETLPEVEIKVTGRDVRRLLKDGRVRDAAALVGQPPVWSRPRSGSLRLAWAAGRYQAVPLDHPDAPITGPFLDATLEPDGHGEQRLTWPDRAVKYLAIVAGPGDSPPPAAEP